jgi:hypothetical protein
MLQHRGGAKPQTRLPIFLFSVMDLYIWARRLLTYIVRAISCVVLPKNALNSIPFYIGPSMNTCEPLEREYSRSYNL